MIQNTNKCISPLLVTCWFPNEGNQQQGLFILDHAKSLLKANMNVKILFIYIHHGQSFLQTREHIEDVEGIPVMTIEIRSKFWKFLYQLPLLLRKTVLQFSDRKFIKGTDIIHSHALFPAGFFGWQLAQTLNKPFVLTEHWSRASNFLKKHPLRSYGKKVYRKADTVIFVSEYLKNRINGMIKLENSIIIPNPINNALFHYKTKPTTPPVKFTLIAFWKKDGGKRGDLILEAFKGIKDKINLPIQIDFVGSGTALEEYMLLAKKYELPARFCGYEDKYKLSEHLQSSHFFIHPTEIETFGIVVFEALKTGTPVLVSDLDIFKSHINPGNGMMVKNDVTSWQKAILNALQKQYNYAKIAKEYEVPFSEMEVATKTREVYVKALS